MVGEPVQQCPGEPLGAEHVSPLVEGQVGGDQDGASFVALAEDLEEEFRAGGGPGDEAQLVDDQQSEAGQLPLQGEQAPFVPGLHEFVDQGRGGGKAYGHPLWQAARPRPRPRATWVLPVPLVKGGGKTYHGGITVQDKCPAKCSA